MSRKVEFYEMINSYSNVNFLLDIKSDKFKLKHLIESFKLVSKKHPYYRMKLVQNLNDGSLEFIEKTNLDELDHIYVEQNYLTNCEELNNEWGIRLIKHACKKHDSSKSVIYFSVFSFENRHQINACINHAGIDGPGVFTTIEDLCISLDLVLNMQDNNNINELNNLKIISKEFKNIHSNNYEIYGYKIDELKKEELLNENDDDDKFLNCLKSSCNQLNNIDKAYVSAEFKQFNEQTTKQLVDNCKKNKTTIQGVLSTALAICLLNEKLNNDNKYNNENDINKTYKFYNSCPCNMRDLIEPKIANDELLCASALLTWPQHLNGNMRLWDIAANTSDMIKKARDDKQGIKWWIKLKNSIETQKYSMMSSSMGIINMNDTIMKLKHFEIVNIKFLGSCYDLPLNANGSCMTHAYTLFDKFTFTFSYTYPQLSKEWAKHFSNNILIILEYFSSGQDTLLNLNQLLDKLNKFKNI